MASCALKCTLTWNTMYPAKKMPLPRPYTASEYPKSAFISTEAYACGQVGTPALG